MRLIGILTTAVLLMTGLGGCSSSTSPSGPPTDAGRQEFCATQTSLFEELVGDVDDPQVPSDADMAAAVQDWAKDLEEVGTPADIPSDARSGFERLIAQARDIDPASFSIDRLDELAAAEWKAMQPTSLRRSPRRGRPTTTTSTPRCSTCWASTTSA